jgi:hypothetical protein
MARFNRAIHVFAAISEGRRTPAFAAAGVDGRVKPGHGDGAGELSVCTPSEAKLE